MCLTTHINSSLERMRQLKHRLGEVGSVLMGMIEGAIEREGGSLSEAETLDASGNGVDDQDGGEGSGGTGVSLEGSIRVESLMPWESGLIAEMEMEATEAGAGGWFNGNLEEVLESWSRPNSDALASQDRVGTPNLVRVPDNIVQPAILRSLMEGPLQP